MYQTAIATPSVAALGASAATKEAAACAPSAATTNHLRGYRSDARNTNGSTTNPTIAGTTKMVSVIDACVSPKPRSMSGAPMVGAPEASSSSNATTFSNMVIAGSDRTADQMRSVNRRPMGSCYQLNAHSASAGVNAQRREPRAGSPSETDLSAGWIQ